MKNIALIPAAGSGSRMGTKLKKQYLNLAGQPMLTRTVLLFQKCSFIDEIILVTPPEDIDFCYEEIVIKERISKLNRIIAGGKTRAESVYNGLKDIDVQKGDIVLIHDGARPFASQELIKRLLDFLRETTDRVGVVPVIPVKDTIKIIEDDLIANTPPRAKLFSAQTPQCFYLDKLLEAFSTVGSKMDAFTDESSLMESIGFKVGAVKGEEQNIKITTPQDLIFAQYLIERIDNK